MRTYITIICTIISFSLFAQKQEAVCDFAIVNTDSIKYFRDNNEEVLIEKNSVTKVLAYDKDSNRYLCQFIIKEYSQTGEEDVYIDKLLLSEDQITMFNSKEAPEKYICKKLGSFIKNGGNIDKITSWEYLSDDNLLKVSYTSTDPMEPWASTAIYKIIDDEPVFYFQAPALDCEFLKIDSVYMLHNLTYAELFKESDYMYDSSMKAFKLNRELSAPEVNEMQAKLSYGSKSELIFDKSKMKFTVKTEAGFEKIFVIQNGKFIRE